MYTHALSFVVAAAASRYFGVGSVTDMKVYNDQFFSGMYEVLQTNVDAFNGSSANCIRLLTEASKGQFQNQSFFQKPSGLVSHRDPSSTSGVTSGALAQGEVTSVKVNKRIGPIENTLDSFKIIGSDIGLMSFILGQQAAVDVQAQFLTSAVSSLVGAYKVAGLTTNLTYSALSDSTKTMNHLALVKALAKFGDQAQRVKLWVMPSKCYFDLVGQAITDKLLEVTAGAIYGGSPGTLGRPVLVTDVTSLYDTNATSSTTTDDFYWTFGLTEDAVRITESEDRSMLIMPVTGYENLTVRLQGEFAYNVGLKGLKFGSQVNPTDAQLATSSNWTKAAADYKSLPGVALKTQ